MASVDIGYGSPRWRIFPARIFRLFAIIGLSGCIGGPGDECGGRKSSWQTPAGLSSLAGCWSQGDIDTTAGYFSYGLYCFSTDSTLLRADVFRSRYNGTARELWGEFRMHSQSRNWFSLELASAFHLYTLGNGETRVDTAYPDAELGTYFLRGDSLVAGEQGWCGFQPFKPAGRAGESALETLAAYTQGPFAGRLREYLENPPAK